MNQYLIYALIALGLFASGVATGWHEKALRVPALLEAQQTADNKQCNIDKQISRETNDQLQKDRDSIADRLTTLLMQQPAKCVPVTGKTQLSTSGKPGHAGQNGIRSQWLRQYAAECETYRREVTSCVGFINMTWAAHGQ